MLRLTSIAALVVCNAGCAVLGPSCIARQERGTVTTISGDVGAGQVASHTVRYATEGSQNDANFSWAGDTSPEGPRLNLYATKAGCSQFSLPPDSNTGDCATLARAGSLDSGNIATTLVITHGRGNPERLGDPPEYKLWIVGDAARAASYTIRITWFYGPDC